jgi:hypothetical protein
VRTRGAVGAVAVGALLVVLLACGGAAFAQNKQPDDSGPAVQYDLSAPLTQLGVGVTPEPDKKDKKEKKKAGMLPVHGGSPGAPDPALQSSPGSAAAPTLGLNLEGVGQGFTGPSGTFSVNSAPPDPNGAVGPNNYVQLVNESFAIFNKSGAAIYGPVPTNTLWSGFGGGCQSNDDGDATVVYDRTADRWIFQQFSVSTTPYLDCVAVSKTGDPTGQYYRYAFQYSNFPDYPKVGVWPDAYYVTFNMFSSSTGPFVGPEICAWDRTKMLTGQPATQQCKTLGTNDGGMLPADSDGATPPPAGAPDPIVEFGTNDLLVYKFHVDWSNTANTVLTGPATIPVAAFAPACNGGGTCIPQSGTSQQLDSLADRLMYRLEYRNFGDHDSLVVDHSIVAGSSVGVRWYELRNVTSPTSDPVVYQQGTYAPDSSYRWMGSAAMDGSGDIALGYSVSSSAIHPAIRYTAHAVSDPLGVMGQGEGSIIEGAGSQTKYLGIQPLSRWGDYSSLSVDPSDDCTFWYTNEYLASNGAFNWHTRIGTFKVAGCGTTASPDFTVVATPASQTVTAGASTTYTATANPANGYSKSVNWTVSGLPIGAAGSFSPTSTAPNVSSTLTVTTNSSTTPAGSYTLTITGSDGTLSHTTQVMLVVQSQAQVGDYTVTATPKSQTVSRGSAVSYTITITPVNGFAGNVSLTVSGVPPKASASFSPSSTTSTSTLTVTTSRATGRGSYTLTITGTSGTLSHSTTVTLVVQ